MSCIFPVEKLKVLTVAHCAHRPSCEHVYFPVRIQSCKLSRCFKRRSRHGRTVVVVSAVVVPSHVCDSGCRVVSLQLLLKRSCTVSGPNCCPSLSPAAPAISGWILPNLLSCLPPRSRQLVFHCAKHLCYQGTPDYLGSIMVYLGSVAGGALHLAFAPQNQIGCHIQNPQEAGVTSPLSPCAGVWNPWRVGDKRVGYKGLGEQRTGRQRWNTNVGQRPGRQRWNTKWEIKPETKSGRRHRGRQSGRQRTGRQRWNTK